VSSVVVASWSFEFRKRERTRERERKTDRKREREIVRTSVPSNKGRLLSPVGLALSVWSLLVWIAVQHTRFRLASSSAPVAPTDTNNIQPVSTSFCLLFICRGLLPSSCGSFARILALLYFRFSNKTSTIPPVGRLWSHLLHLVRASSPLPSSLTCIH
jgi:hypothetical protein